MSPAFLECCGKASQEPLCYWKDYQTCCDSPDLPAACGLHDECCDTWGPPDRLRDEDNEEDNEEDEEEDLCSDCGYPNPGYCKCCA